MQRKCDCVLERPSKPRYEHSNLQPNVPACSPWTSILPSISSTWLWKSLICVCRLLAIRVLDCWSLLSFPWGFRWPSLSPRFHMPAFSGTDFGFQLLLSKPPFQSIEGAIWEALQEVSTLIPPANLWPLRQHPETQKKTKCWSGCRDRRSTMRRM